MINRVGEKIRQLRVLAGLSQENIAEEIGMSHGNFGKIERGEIDINTHHLFAVAKALKVDVTDLFDFNSIGGPVKDSKVKSSTITKSDIDQLHHSISAINKAIENIQIQINNCKINTDKKTPRKK
jgi:transcriptional regulator with XRE-family HTH domain